MYLTKFRYVLALAGGITCAMAMPAVIVANVYPTNLGQSSNSLNPAAAESITFSYLLNEDATDVSVSILDSGNNVVRTISAGAQAKGTQSVIWDGTDNGSNVVPVGNYSFRVTSSGAVRANWEVISTDNVLNNFELPRGVAVNTNPDSPYYGRVYVSNGRDSATAEGRAMEDAVYMLNADFSDTGILGGSGPHNGGVTVWSSSDSGGTGPFRLEVGPDDSLYITNWSDGHSGLWQADPNMTAAFEALDSTGRDASGLNVTHGSISDVIVTGSGASRTIYTTDEDFSPIRSILQYDIGNSTTFSGAPTDVFFDNAAEGGVIVNSLNSVSLASDGTFWMSQPRFDGTDEASLIQIDGGGSIIWNSLDELGSPDPLRGIQGIAYDAVNDLLALVTNVNATGGNIIIFDPNAKSILTQFAFGATTNTDVAFDNVGNLYVGNRSAERVRIWSPPSEGDYVANTFSTNSLGGLGSITVIPEPSNLLLLGLGLLGLVGVVRRK